MGAYAQRVATQRRCDCGEAAEFRYVVLIDSRPAPLYLCPHCLIAELEMQLEQTNLNGSAHPLPASEASAVVRRYIKLERERLVISPQQQEINIDQARRLLATLRQLERIP